MTKVQFIKTVGGEELAVLPKAEYERLLAAESENAGSTRVARKARAALAACDEVALPKAVVDRLAAGENAIRALREWRGMVQAELVIGLGITQGYLSDLETGKRKGPVAMHQKIARALDVPIDLLLPMAVSDVEADPDRYAKRSATVRQMKADRTRKRQ